MNLPPTTKRMLGKGFKRWVTISIASIIVLLVYSASKIYVVIDKEPVHFSRIAKVHETILTRSPENDSHISPPPTSAKIGYLQEQIVSMTGGLLQPGQPGKCWFHGQLPHHADRALFTKLGGVVHADQCKLEKPRRISDMTSEAHLCPCVAPAVDKFNKHFLEIGALDGQSLSNLLFFESQMGWRGVCVEGSPHNYKLLVENRPDCYNVHGVVGKQLAGKVTTFLTFWKGGSWESSMSCVLGTGLCESMDKAKEYARGSGTDLRVDEVPGHLLSDIFEKAGYDDFEWLMLDVEGAELMVLETIDFGKVKAEHVTTETMHDKIRDLLESKGYQQKGKLGLDTLFVPLRI